MIEPGALATAQMAHNLARQQEIGGHAGVIGLVEVFSAGGVDAGRAAAVGIVDEDVHLAQALHHIVYEAGDGIAVVLRQAEAGVAAAGQGRGELGRPLPIAAGHRQGRARFRQPAAHRGAQQAGRTGDDDDFAAQIQLFGDRLFSHGIPFV